MKTKLFIIIILVLSALMLSACSGPTFFRADSMDPMNIYDGHEVVIKEGDSVFVSVEFDSQSGNEFVYYVEIENRGEKQVEINPREISLQCMNSNLVDENEKYKPLFALDPEQEIQNAEKQAKGRENEHEIITGVNAAVAVFSILGALVDNNPHNDGRRIVHEIGRWTGTQINEEIRYDEDKKYIESKRQFWKNEALRESAINPGETIGGLVYIPFNPKFHFIRFTIPVNDNYYDFFYKIEKLK